MEAFGGLQRRLTKLYSDTKHSCDVVTKEEKVANVPELLALHLEFRIQRERLSAWGLEWSDDNVAAEGSIDEAVARAGLTETVTEVLRNIQDVLEEAERIRCTGSGTTRQVLGSEKARIRLDDDVVRWSIEDRARYEQLAKDLKDAIDLLYDLSRTRRELREGTYPSSGKSKLDRQTTPPQPPPTKAIFTTAAFSESSDTLINSNPVRTATLLSTQSSNSFSSLELPSRLDPNLLELPEEQPPPYDRIGATLSSRMIAHLKQPSFPSSSDDEESVVRIPVLVEFAPFDPAYRVTGVSVPTKRLDALLAFYARSSVAYEDPAGGNLSCLGFFEDIKNPRFGLVYELPKSVSGSSASIKSDKEVTPTTLLKMMQASSKSTNTSSRMLPPGPYLEDRFRMAFNLVHAFYRMHNEERFSHKNVNSENILLFPKHSESESQTRIEYDVRTPYISSFDLFTEFNLEKLHASPAKHLYRSEEDPIVSARTCQTCNAQSCTCSPYRFDIYSLGMVLLEIGLWMPLFDLYKPKYSLADFHRRIEALWLRRVRTKCGSVYTSVVQDMLKQGSSGISDESLTELYSSWLTKLRKCCLIDDMEDPWSMGLPLVRQQLSWSPKQSSGRGQQTLQPTPVPYAISEAAEEGLDGETLTEATRHLLNMRRSQTWNSRDAADDQSKTAVSVSVTKYQSAARTIQRAWRSKQYRNTFKEYRDKVSIIQRLWRRRKSGISTFRPRQGNTQRIVSDGIVLETELVRSVASEHTIVHIERAPVMQPKPKLRIHNVKLQPALLDLWHGEYQPRLERIVNHALRHSPESASIELHMVGETAVTAKPTVFITCSSTSKVRGTLARKWNYDPAVIDIKVRRGKIRRSKAAKCKPKTLPHRSMVNGGSCDSMPLNPFHQQRPVCGASIGAFVGKHLPPVSFGGIVDVDGEVFGMTVHHLLDDPSDDEEESEYEEETAAGALRSSGRHQNPDHLNSLIDGIGGNPTLQSFPTDSMFPFEISDDEDDFVSDEEDEDTGYSSEDSSSEETDDSGTQGDIGGIIAGSRPDILVTQPALDDIDDDFFPCPEDRDEDHLDSHTLGHVYASSGIKRWNRKGVLHEIDWALLKLEENRLQPCNLIQGGGRYYQDPTNKKALSSRLHEPIHRSSYPPEEDEFPTTVAKSDDLSNLWVHCFGRTSGLQRGRIGPTMSSVRIYKRRSFSRSWYVIGDFGVGGDSGAWVIDNEQGRVCGHVLAWCSRNNIAYICPAEVLLDDMKRTLGASRICLPGSVEEKRTAGRMIAPSPSSMQSIGGISADSGLPDIQRLGLGDNGLMRSRLNGSAVSPRMEMLGLFGQEIAR